MSQPSAFARVQALLRGYTATQAIYVAVRLGLVDLLGEETLGVDALAHRVDASPDGLQRLLRALVAHGILREPEVGRYAVDEAGRCLREGADGDLRGWALLTGEVLYHARGGLLDGARTGRSPFEDRFGDDFFAYLTARPELRRCFDAGMGRQTAEVARRMAEALPFAEGSVVVDVGGGQGTLLAHVLGRHPSCRGVLFDRDATQQVARDTLGAAGLLGRCELVAGSFFDDVPAGGDTYTLSWILHDWDDADSVAILKRVAAAMGQGSRLLIVEALLPERVTGPDPVIESDLAMLVLLGGRERTVAQYGELLARAGLRLERTVDLGAGRGVIEARRA